MSTKSFRFPVFLAPVMVAAGVFAVFTLSGLLVRMAGAGDLHGTLKFFPRFVILWVGWANVLTFLPIFIAGFLKLRPQGAVGRSPVLVSSGIFRYVRNPMYAGVSFTLFGLGLIINSAATTASGLVWLAICLVQCKREESWLLRRFGTEYARYRSDVPMFIPDFQRLVRDGFRYFFEVWKQ
ncbi:MAG: isoprenylcysteine carboxylmethyltransferase family protein [Bacteroidales bacterium]|nr:isoprenylcysteine carboxylmethyltransferase family protein [Bacteroidales bacterium]